MLWQPSEQHELGPRRYGASGLRWLWPDPPERRVILSRGIVDDRAPIVSVFRESDGDWQFLDGGDVEADDIRVAHLGDIASNHPYVNDL
ncbi:MAG: hypothetical protein ACRDQZ_18605, partial [Mycobacteriales bacterium]